MRNVLTVDVEEYFQAAEVQETADDQAWASAPSRVEAQTRVVLDLLDEKDTKATFFIVGSVAEKHPELVREILRSGHEIGCHSYAHKLIYQLTPEQFRADTIRALAAIADACGQAPKAYRAPSYSITAESMWALEVLVECGFTHDSSIYPIAHDRYGIPGFSRHPQVLHTKSGPIQEVPIATVRLSKTRVAPVGGGGYLRLFPYCYTAAGVRRMNEVERQPACIYFHPWELDRHQPRLARGFLSRLRTYHGLAGMTDKIRRLQTDFEFATLRAVHPVLANYVPVAGETVHEHG